jgi:hypothetical protein
MAQRVAAEAAPTASIFLAVTPLVPAGQPQAVDLHQNLRIIGGEEPIVQDFNLRLQARQASPAKMGGWRYRWRQFRWALGARIREEDRAMVARFLPPEAQALFRRMPRGDQRHSLAVLRTLLEWGETHPALLQAALLHDVGKAAAPLSPWERALLVLTEALCPPSWRRILRQLPLLRRWAARVQRYRAHPEIGAAWAQAAGCDPLTVALIRRHQEPLGPPQPEEDLETRLLRRLQEADGRN